MIGFIYVVVTYITRGNATTALKTAQNVASGNVLAGGQSHFYMETQAALGIVP